MIKCKVLIFLFLFCLSISSLFAASSWKIEQYTYMSDTEKPTITLYAKSPINDKFTITGFFLVNNAWGEGYLGLNYAPEDWISFEFELGIEAYEKFLRYSPSVYIKKGDYYFTGVLEIGGSVNWYNLRGDYKYKQLNVGAMIARFYGFGPRIDYSVPGTDIKVWTAALYEWEEEKYGLMFGISSIFE